MASKNVTPLTEAASAVPEYLTDERLNLSLAANADASYCLDAALRWLDKLSATESEAEAVLRALLLRARDLLGVSYHAAGSADSDLQELQRDLNGGVH